MQRFPVFLCFWLVPTLMVLSAEPVPLTTQQILRANKSGQWQLWTQVTVCKLETRTRTVTKKIPESSTVTEEVDGNVVEKTVTQYKDIAETQQYTVCVPVYQPMARVVSASMLRACETDGRVIPHDKLRVRVGNGALVVVYGTTGSIPESYAALFKAGTIVIAMDGVQEQVPDGPATAAVPSVSGPLTGIQGQTTSPRFPDSPAPQFVMLSRIGLHDILVRRTSESTSPMMGMAVFRKGTTTEQAPVSMMHTIRQSETFTVADQHLQFHMGQSVDIPLEQIQERFSRETAVVYSSDGEAVDAFWLQNLKSTTIVVTGPQLSPLSASAVPVVVPTPETAPVTVPSPMPVPGPSPVPTPGPSIPETAPANPQPMPASSVAVDAASVTPTTEPSNAFEQSVVERDLIRLVNLEREKIRLSTLSSGEFVTLAARKHAANMAQSGTLAHELNGKGVGERLDSVGFHWNQCGENIACGQKTPAEAFESWMNSPGHRANLLGAHYNQIGVAVADSADGKKYWTMVLALGH